MRSVTKRLAELIERLLTRRPLALLNVVAPIKTDTESDVRRELAEAVDPALIPQITQHVFSRLPDVGLAATQCISKLLALATPEDLPHLEDAIRTTWRSAYHEPVFVDALLSSSEVNTLGLLSFHPSGFRREAALRRLAAINDGSELPYLLLRLADWVPEVRHTSQRLVRARVQRRYVDRFVRNLMLVDRAGRLRSMDDGSLAEPLVRLFGTSAGEAAMLDVLGSGSRYNQRAVVRFALDRLPSVAPAIAQAAASSADAMIRVWIVPVVAQVLPIAIAVRILERLVRDPFPRVRREALTTLARWFPGQARPHLQNGIFDSSATVREVSRFLLRESSVEFAVQYRAALTTQSNARTLANAIAGLGEVGAAPDADVTAQHLSHPTSKVRRVAAKTVMRLAPERYLQSVLGILQDPSPMVSTAARNALVRHAHAITRSALMAIFATATAPHVRKNVIALLSSLPKWDAIISLLQVVSDSDAELVSIACRHLRRWNAQYNRSQAAPSRVELEELARALARADQTLDEATVREIRFAMSAFI